jgi:glutamate-5-semialdehyde dehydrogenase
VLTSLGGNCHTYVDASANIVMAEEIAFNAKVSRPSVCNAMETLLVHAEVADALLPNLVQRLVEAGVEVRGCERTQVICPGLIPATENDWATEYLDLILAVRVVDSLHEALDHIERFGTSHSEAIVTQNQLNAELFTREVDAACVYVNASTRFTDGFEFGFGAEVAISTQKLHARGPVGLRELTTYKTIVIGEGQIRT